MLMADRRRQLKLGLFFRYVFPAPSSFFLFHKKFGWSSSITTNINLFVLFAVNCWPSYMYLVLLIHKVSTSTSSLPITYPPNDLTYFSQLVIGVFYLPKDDASILNINFHSTRYLFNSLIAIDFLVIFCLLSYIYTLLTTFFSAGGVSESRSFPVGKRANQRKFTEMKCVITKTP